MLKFMNHLIINSVATMLLAFVAIPAQAVTSNTTFKVTVKLVKSCIISATDLSFGNYDPMLTGANTGTSTISATCTVGDVFKLALNKGMYGTFTGRIMKDAANDNLTYNLYTTSDYTVVWGNGNGGTVKVSGTGAGPSIPVVFTVYGQIPAGQNVPANSYNDIITVTITF